MFVEARESGINGAGEGLFARVDIEQGTVMAFYNGLKVSGEEEKLELDDYTLMLDEEYDLDVPGRLHRCCHLLVLTGRIKCNILVCWDCCAWVLHFVAVWILFLLGS